MDASPVLQRISTYQDQIRSWRHDIHRHPELAYEEHRTASMVANLLRSFGVDEVFEGIGVTGVVGLIRNGDGPMVGLRADMDALPIDELAERSHRSQHRGKMHACGHDGHTAMALAAARYLAESRQFSGTVAMVFQPAEEGGAGAKAMIDDGLWERFPMRDIYGMHNIPGIPAGAIALSAGPVMAAADRFTVEIRGHGGHAAAPHLCRDPIIAGAAVVTALQTLVSRNCPPNETLVISITEFHGGDAFNVIPDCVRLNGTVRYFQPDVGAMAQERMAVVIQGICAAYQVEADFRYRPGYPPTVNWDQPTALARQSAASVFGTDQVLDQLPLMFAEDFSYFLQDKPGCYGFIGNGDESGDLGCTGLHNPHYDFNDNILVSGAGFLARVAEDALRRD
jgi:hippurate hydrolase